MDQTVVGDGDGVSEMDAVQVIGDGHGAMTLDDAARMTGTINYELATRLTARVPRVYVRHGRPTAVEHPMLGESHELE